MVKNPPANARDVGLIPGSRRSPGEGNGNLLQYSCLGNPADRGTWSPTVHGVAKSWTRLSNFTSLSHYMLTTELDFRMNLRTFSDFSPYFGQKLREEWLGN